MFGWTLKGEIWKIHFSQFSSYRERNDPDDAVLGAWRLQVPWQWRLAIWQISYTNTTWRSLYCRNTDNIFDLVITPSVACCLRWLQPTFQRPPPLVACHLHVQCAIGRPYPAISTATHVVSTWLLSIVIDETVDGQKTVIDIKSLFIKEPSTVTCTQEWFCRIITTWQETRHF